MDEQTKETTVIDEPKPTETKEQMEFMVPGFEKNDQLPRENQPSMDPRRDEYRRSIEEAFQALMPGMKISVTRLKPKFAAGWVDTFDVEFDEFNNPVIDLGEIKEAYGGEKLMLRFLDSHGRYLWANTVDFRGVPPRDNGVEIENPRIREKRELMELERKKDAQNQVQNNDALLKTVMQMQEKNHEAVIRAMQGSIKESKPFGQLDDMLAALGKLEMLRGNQQAPGNGNGDISGMLSGLVSMLASGQLNVSQPQQQQRQSQPQPQRPPVRMPMAGVPQNVVPFNTAQKPEQRMPETKASEPPPNEMAADAVENENDENSDDLDIVDELAGMEDSELAETVAELLGTIGEERTAKIFAHFERLAKAE